MLTIDDIAAWDAVTASRGRAYARSGRVTVLRSGRGRVEADVQGSDLYRVHIRPDLQDYACTCPVGGSGALCKHVAAVVVVLADDGQGAHEPAESDEITGWLDALDAPALRALLDAARDQLPEVADLLSRAYVTISADVARLAAEVDAVLTPRRSFYEYGAAQAYADAALDLVETIEDVAERSATPELLKAVERALTLVTRAALRSDTSSGGHGMVVDRLLAVHARVANAPGVMVSAKDRKRVATWLFRFRFDGKQDDFDPEVDRYADALGADGVSEYRRLVDGADASGTDEFAVLHARQRLAVLDRDVDAIVATFGRGLPGQAAAVEVVRGLDDAGFSAEAVAHARRGLAMPAGHLHARLVDRAVRGALEAGAVSEAVEMRAAHLQRQPSATTFLALRDQARAAGTWAAHESEAEELLRGADPAGLLSVLLRDGRDDEAWALATADPHAARHDWPQLCRLRARTHPGETLPHYRRIVTEVLSTTGPKSYAAAARLLVAMRTAAQDAGLRDEFVDFMVEVVETNRRRPTCIDRFVSAGLVTRDRTVRLS
ncbi:SWIM zinc finger domain-containing protein [Cellulomonas sp. PSBB021]|uniref:SWIM zinc finger family protein n=1 Tax=Cellulomonas sp. PSBB021 TaxID=2003551 RepID=UPI0012FE343F|nr:SWIM zinc finger family protein [Cellulomonas sp. PSBB021]